jgi:hypothetical protein
MHLAVDLELAPAPQEQVLPRPSSPLTMLEWPPYLQRVMPMKKIVAVLVVLVAGHVLAADPPSPPLGKWTALGLNATSTLDLKEGRLTWNINSGLANLTIQADYSITKEGVLYAVITKVETNLAENKPVKDDTFSFRYLVDGDELQVKGIKGKPFDDHPGFKTAAQSEQHHKEREPKDVPKK